MCLFSGLGWVCLVWLIVVYLCVEGYRVNSHLRCLPVFSTFFFLSDLMSLVLSLHRLRILVMWFVWFV